MGTDELAERLGSRVLYVPWGAESVMCAAELALELRDETHGRGLVIVDQLTVVPDELAAWPHRTLRTRTPVDGGDVVAIIRPSYDLLAEVRRPAAGFTIVAEDPSDPLRGWARFVGARDMSTGEVLSLDLDEWTQASFNDLVESGYNGWTDERSKEGCAPGDRVAARTRRAELVHPRLPDERPVRTAEAVRRPPRHDAAHAACVSAARRSRHSLTSPAR